MIKIKYNNLKIYEEVTFSKVGNIVSLKRASEKSGTFENNSGFKTYRLNLFDTLDKAYGTLRTIPFVFIEETV